jgi:hypothetical protein
MLPYIHDILKIIGWILAGAIVLYIISYIQMKAWIHAVESFFKQQFTNIKSKNDGNQKEE